MHLFAEKFGYYEEHNYKNRQDSFALVMSLENGYDFDRDNSTSIIEANAYVKYTGKIVRAYQTDIGTFLLIDSNGEKY